MSDPILDLSTETPDRQFVRIDGEPYPLATSEDFSLEVRAGMGLLLTRIGELEELTKPGDADDAEHRALMRRMVGHLLPDAPADAIEQIGFSGQTAVITVFFANAVGANTALGLLTQLTAETTAETESPTGTNSSPDSSASMPEATPGAG